jgi:hypothetical protein
MINYLETGEKPREAAARCWRQRFIRSLQASPSIPISNTLGEIGKAEVLAPPFRPTNPTRTICDACTEFTQPPDDPSRANFDATWLMWMKSYGKADNGGICHMSQVDRLVFTKPIHRPRIFCSSSSAVRLFGSTCKTSRSCCKASSRRPRFARTGTRPSLLLRLDGSRRSASRYSAAAAA